MQRDCVHFGHAPNAVVDRPILIGTHCLAARSPLTGLSGLLQCIMDTTLWSLMAFAWIFYPGAGPGFLEGGFKPTKESSFSAFYMIFLQFPHK